MTDVADQVLATTSVVNQQPKILVGLGYTQHVAEAAQAQGLPLEPWRAANALDDAGFSVNVRSCEQNNDACGMQPSDIQTADAAAVYSWSLQTLLDKFNFMAQHGLSVPTWKLLCICLGVQNPCYRSQPIPVPSNAEKVVMFQLADAFPCSGEAKGDPVVDITDFDALSKIIAAGPVVNVNCRRLWGAIANPVEMHTATENHDVVVDLMVALFRYYCKTEGA